MSRNRAADVSTTTIADPRSHDAEKELRPRHRRFLFHNKPMTMSLIESLSKLREELPMAGRAAPKVGASSTVVVQQLHM